MDFGAGRVALVSGSTGERLDAHLTATDPHGTAAVLQSMKGAPGGFAGLDQSGTIPLTQLPADGRYAPASTTPTNPVGLYVPPGWGQRWRSKRDAAKAGTGKAVVAAVGSSTFMGLYSSNPPVKGTVGTIASGLQSLYGDGGSGYSTSAWNPVTLSDETPAAISLWTGNGSVLGLTGTGWGEGGQLAGPGCHYLITSNPGDSVTFKVRGSRVVIYTLGKDGGRASWTYSIDGGQAVTVTDTVNGTLTPIATTISGLTATTHTVTIKHAGTSGQYLSVSGVSGENSTGVVVNNFARSGAIASSYSQSGRITWNGGPDYPADLLLYCVGANDAYRGTAVDSWSASVRQFLQSVMDGTSASGVASTGTTDVVIVMQHIGKMDTANWRYHDYIARGRGIAEAYGAAFINIWPMGRNSWNYWNSLGYWGNGSNPAVSGSDSIHMCDAGHAAVANAILPVLTS
ncbi:GDSL-type esterase/lipase family protein [Kitasatospora cineracea]|uniref:GDSL-type esterase/lipase family protein n=1 Tax=Kitasatospora cineracea TaxID=88074 RepID=UPI0033C53646